jgi:hypothetical protein
MAVRYVWWESASSFPDDLESLAVRVMNDATLEDAKEFRRIVGDDFLRRVLLTVPAILFSPGAFGYWHNRLGVPRRPLPLRSEGIEPGVTADY